MLFLLISLSLTRSWFVGADTIALSLSLSVSRSKSKNCWWLESEGDSTGWRVVAVLRGTAYLPRGASSSSSRQRFSPGKHSAGSYPRLFHFLDMFGQPSPYSFSLALCFLLVDHIGSSSKCGGGAVQLQISLLLLLLLLLLILLLVLTLSRDERE